MKLLIKKIARSNLGIFLRNTLKFKPVQFDLGKLDLVTVSDAFAWRTDNGFVTKFKYSDILNLFYKVKNSYVEIHFFTYDNKLLKKMRVKELDLSNELLINPDFFNGLKSFGTFSIYHYTKEKLNDESIISNRCYPGYSHNNNLFSFVHGNALASYSDINDGDSVKTDIVKTSFLKNHTYKIQKYFADFDKSELFFTNPTSKVINFAVNGKNFNLKKGCSKIVEVSNEVITIKSNCLFLRPFVFSYKNGFLDVHHS